MAATAAECPGRYDVILNGQGYTLLRTLDGSYLSASRHRAEYSSTPTFVERQNISNAYGDNAQDFFLTIRQRDWSLGEQQKYFRAGNDGRYWQGTNIDVSTPGQVSLMPKSPALTFAAAVRAVSRYSSGNRVLTASSTTLYSVDVDGSITSLGAHGLGANPSKFGLVDDGTNNYLTTLNTGTVGVRKWDAASFTTFSATGSDSLAFLNNTLYGYRGVNGDLGSYDSTGTWTTLFTWKGGDGTAFAPGAGQSRSAILEAYGGKLIILFPYGQQSAELWVYDGSGVSTLAIMPPNFTASDMCVLYGVVYIAGAFSNPASTSSVYTRPTILFFDGSQLGLLWQADGYSSTAVANSINGPNPAVDATAGRLFFTDDYSNTVKAYDPGRGGISTVATYSAGGTDVRLHGTATMLVHTRNQTGGYYFPHLTDYPTSGTVISSLIDFDSSLPKNFRGASVIFDAATDGDGGSVDISYQVDSLSGSWTTLKTGAASGTEYTFSGVSGHAVAIKITLNKGTSTAGPTLKSLNLRAAPVLTSFKVRTYNLDLSSTPDHPTRLEDGSEQTVNGFTQAQNLQTAISSTSPFSVTDKFGTFTAVCEPSNCSFFELHSKGASQTAPGQYVAQITVREV